VPSEWEKEKESGESAGVIEDFSEKQTPAFQLHNRFIVTQIKSGFILIDQQAAHERILYEKYLKGLELNNLTTQQQLFPETLHITSSDVELLRELLPEFSGLGFDIQNLAETHLSSMVFHPILKKVIIKNLLKGCWMNSSKASLQ
jgi:DNA mismatch repair protein MutL